MNDDVARYFSECDHDVKKILTKVRTIVYDIEPECDEKISWGMPTYKKDNCVFHFAATKKHLGIYPGPEAIEEFSSQFDEQGLKYQKGSLLCPYEKEIPYTLIESIVAFVFKKL